MYYNYIISVGMGIIVYLLLYLNKLENLNNNNDEMSCISSYNLSIKIPMIISILVFIILNNFNYLNKHSLNTPINTVSENMDIFTDNVSYWF